MSTTFQPVQLQKCRLAGSGCTSSATSIVLQSLKFLDGTDVVTADFADLGFATVEPGTSKEESIKFTGVTQNADGTATLTGVTRGLAFDSPYDETAGNKQSHAGGSILVFSNTSAFYGNIKDYADGIASAGAADASSTVKGITKLSVEPSSASNPIALGENDPRVPTQDENDALAGNSGTPSVANKYVTETGLSTATSAILPAGVISPYAGRTAPTGWLLCDGSAVSRTTYANLLAAIAPSQAFTVTIASPGVLTATAHGLVVGDRISMTTTGGLPSGLAANTDYYVISAGYGADAFQVSLVPGGTAVVTTGSQSGVHTLYKTAFGKGDGSTTFNVPDMRSVMPVGRAASAPTITLSFDDGLVSTGNDTITVPDKFFPAQGQEVTLSTSGTLPTGLSIATYYVIRASATTIKLATTQAAANAGTGVDITAASGGGVHTITYTLSTNTVLGKRAGEEFHGISDAELASHKHDVLGYTGGGFDKASYDQTGNATGEQTWVSNVLTTATVGSDTPHNNMPPVVAVNYIIKT